MKLVWKIIALFKHQRNHNDFSETLGAACYLDGVKPSLLQSTDTKSAIVSILIMDLCSKRTNEQKKKRKEQTN